MSRSRWPQTNSFLQGIKQRKEFSQQNAWEIKEASGWMPSSQEHVWQNSTHVHVRLHVRALGGGDGHLFLDTVIWGANDWEIIKKTTHGD